jgi:hypothetical protein
MNMDNTQLTPDQDGYYTVVLSRIGRPDRHGMVKLPLSPILVQKLLHRAKTGALHGEYGQPTIGAEQPPIDFVQQRYAEIAETQVSHHIASIEFSQVSDPKAIGGKVMLVRGRIKPVGPFGPALKDRIDNGEPLYFGMRSFTQPADFTTPSMIHRVTHVVTWDLINSNPCLDNATMKFVVIQPPVEEELEPRMMTREEWAAAVAAKVSIDRCYIDSTLAHLAEQMRLPDSVFLQGLEKSYRHYQPIAFYICKPFASDNDIPNNATIHQLHAEIRAHGWYVASKVHLLLESDMKAKGTDCRFELRHYLSPDPLESEGSGSPFGGIFGF